MSALAALAEPVPPRTLVIDIETTPALVWRFGPYYAPRSTSLEQVKEHGSMLSFAARWVGERRIHFHAAWDDADAMRQAVYDLLCQADAVVGYNSDRFDLPKIEGELATHGFPPTPPVVSVDLLRTVRRRFGFDSNKLDHALDRFGLERKLQTGGFELWRDCIEGDPAARRRMERYNRQDVRATEELLHKITPWLTAHAHRGLFGYLPHEAGQSVCSRCGGELTRDGYYHTRLSRYDRFRCKACGSWSRGKKALAAVGARGVQ